MFTGLLIFTHSTLIITGYQITCSHKNTPENRFTFETVSPLKLYSAIWCQQCVPFLKLKYLVSSNKVITGLMLNSDYLLLSLFPIMISCLTKYCQALLIIQYTHYCGYKR